MASASIYATKGGPGGTDQGIRKDRVLEVEGVRTIKERGRSLGRVRVTGLKKFSA